MKTKTLECECDPPRRLLRLGHHDRVIPPEDDSSFVTGYVIHPDDRAVRFDNEDTDEIERVSMADLIDKWKENN